MKLDTSKFDFKQKPSSSKQKILDKEAKKK